MAKRRDPRREELRQNLTTKQVFHFINEDRGLDIKCKEVFKKKKVIVHFPFDRDGNPKYKTVKKFKFTGFEGDKSLPVGIQKSAAFGLGFTKYLAPLMDVVLQVRQLTEVHILKAGTPSLTSTTLTLTEEVLKQLHPVFKHINDTQRQDRLDLATAQLNQLFPKQISATQKKYIKNSVHSALDSWSHVIEEFSDKDKTAIKSLFDKLVLTGDFLTTDTLLSTKATLDKQYIEDVVEEFKKLMSQQHETAALEKKWQKFLGRHNWVFSYVFSHPIMLVQSEAYVGGKNLSNKSGKVTDFLVKNSLTHNVAFLEIKTHKTRLIGAKRAYRGDDVFPMSKDVTGGITQVLNQRDHFQKEYYKFSSGSGQPLESVNPKCVVLMGSIADLTPSELNSFELFRSNSKDVELLTFDELLSRFENLHTLMTDSSAGR